MTTTNYETMDMPTMEAYDLWADVYDTDGNVLQQLDDIYIDQHLPSFLASLRPLDGHFAPSILDLGCGTGRNTIKLVQYALSSADPAPSTTQIQAKQSPYRIVAVDNSANMLSRAEQRISSFHSTSSSERSQPVDFLLQDLQNVPSHSPLRQKAPFDAIISTLVLEHFHSRPFFQLVSSLLRPGGKLLLTNMHAEMGLKSSAGFLDSKTGKKIKPVSINHSLEDIAQVAEESGLVLKDSSEAAIRDGEFIDEEIERFGERARKWIGVKMHLGMVFEKSEAREH